MPSPTSRITFFGLDASILLASCAVLSVPAWRHGHARGGKRQSHARQARRASRIFMLSSTLRKQESVLEPGCWLTDGPVVVMAW